MAEFIFKFCYFWTSFWQLDVLSFWPKLLGIQLRYGSFYYIKKGGHTMRCIAGRGGGSPNDNLGNI